MLRSAAERLLRLMAPLVLATVAVVWWFDKPVHPLPTPDFHAGAPVHYTHPIIGPATPTQLALRYIELTASLLLIAAVAGVVVVTAGAALGAWDRRRQHGYHTAAVPLL